MSIIRGRQSGPCLVDTNMNEVVTYTYDTWGKLISTGGTLASTVGAKNPYRYPGIDMMPKRGCIT